MNYETFKKVERKQLNAAFAAFLAVAFFVTLAACFTVSEYEELNALSPWFMAGFLPFYGLGSFCSFIALMRVYKYGVSSASDVVRARSMLAISEIGGPRGAQIAYHLGKARREIEEI